MVRLSRFGRIHEDICSTQHSPVARDPLVPFRHSESGRMEVVLS